VVVSITCTAPSSAPTSRFVPLREALRGRALPAREIRDVVPAVMLKLMTKGNGAVVLPTAARPRMYATSPFADRKNCVGVKLPTPRSTEGPTVLVTFRNPRGEGHPGVLTGGVGGPVMLAVTVCTSGGDKATSDSPSGRMRSICPARLTVPDDPAVLGPHVGRNEVCVASAE